MNRWRKKDAMIFHPGGHSFRPFLLDNKPKF